jgi:tetratricopeptide (TPR) repeat protein
MGSNNPTPPQSSQPSGTTTTKQKTKKQKSGSSKEFLDRYHAAHALIYEKSDYQAGITALRAMGYDDNADVATLLGYASRKLGRYDDAKYWYDKALAADPNHALTWSYYGMWHAEQGQPAQGQGRPREGAPNLRHRVQGICRAQRGDRRHPHLLRRANFVARPGRFR